MGEGRVEAEFGADDAKAIGAEEANPVAPGRLSGRPLEGCAARAALGEAGRQHDRGLDTGPAAAIHDRRNGFGTGRDHHQVKTMGTSSTDR